MAQHEYIAAALLQQLAELDAEIERLKEQKDKFMWQVRDTCTRADAAEARVRELEPDAARLDWLQDHLLGEGSADKFGLDHPEWSDSLEWSDIPEGESLRHIVDAAMASEGGG